MKSTFDRCVRVVALVARSRIAIFFAAGAALFFLSPRPAATSHIVLTSEALAAMHAAQAGREGRPLSAQALADLDAQAVDDEVLYREALRLGLDRSDPVVRQHLIQKMLLLAEDLGGASRPATDDELRSWFEKNPARWRTPEQLSLYQVFFRSEAAARAIDPARATRAALAEKGDAFPLPREVRASAEQLTASYGADFVERVRRVPVGTFEAIPSRYGWHLVQVVAHDEAGQASFEEVRPEVALAFARERREQVVRSFLARARERYSIEVAGAPATELASSRHPRLGMRMSPSGED